MSRRPPSLPPGGGALALLVGIGVVLGIAGYPVAAWLWLGGCLAVFGALHLSDLKRLGDWAAAPQARDVPHGHGPWMPVLERLNRLARATATERGEAGAEIERLRAAVNLLPDALVVLDRDNIVQWCNRAAEDLHGIVGQRRPVDHFIRQPEFTRYLASGDFGAAVVLAMPSRPGRTFQTRIVPTPDSLRLLITRDITEQNKLDAMRRDFVANVSHEIRTPLTVMSGFIETMIDIDLPRDEALGYLQTSRKQAVTMQRLLEDLLTLSSLESATANPDEIAFPVEPLLAAQVGDARTLSAGRHVIELDCRQPATLIGAPTQVESAVRNLLTNAIRYTPDGGRITVRFETDAAGARLAVEDTGIGIAAEHLPRLAERFYRVDRGRSRETGGTGLGLAIVKHIAQRHDATLRVTSTVGRGSRFAIEFPPQRLSRD